MSVGCFKRDDDSHWYFVPADKVELWDDVMESNDEDRFFENDLDALSVGGGITNIPVIQVPESGIGDVSDGYHTFNELYAHRSLLFSVILTLVPEYSFVSLIHHDGTHYEGFFIAGINHPEFGQITYHLDMRHWEMLSKHVRVLDFAPKWDGHDSDDVLIRLLNWVVSSDKRNTEQ